MKIVSSKAILSTKPKCKTIIYNFMFYLCLLNFQKLTDNPFKKLTTLNLKLTISLLVYNCYIIKLKLSKLQR